MKVYVDPACNVNYCSFYIKGLWDLFGKKNVIFSSKPFGGLRYTANTHCFAFCIDGKRFVIDYADSNEIFYEPFLLWTDIYGKVNYKPDLLPSIYMSKIVHVGPNFGMGCFGDNKWKAAMLCIKSYLKVWKRLDMTFWSFLSPYLWLYKRAGILNEAPVSSIGSRMIFMVSRFWDGEEEVNQYRINFIRACRRLQSEGIMEFIGGMVPSEKDSACPEDVMLDREIKMEKYMELMKRSLLVFNTPAVHKCHGWKLPEYLSQGKIILSTPFVNELPFAMEHKRNIYFTDVSEDAIYLAVKEIVNDIFLQKKLENGSRRYWDDCMCPKSSMEYFLSSDISNCEQ